MDKVDTIAIVEVLGEGFRKFEENSIMVDKIGVPDFALKELKQSEFFEVIDDPIDNTEGYLWGSTVLVADNFWIIGENNVKRQLKWVEGY